jgi:hypothetical protein
MDNTFQIVVKPAEGFAAGANGAPAAAQVDVSSIKDMPIATIIQIAMSLLGLIIKDSAVLAKIQAVVDLLLPLFQKS